MATAWLLVLLLLLFLSAVNPLYGQNTVGTIVGTVITTDGSSLPGATVTVTNEGTHAFQTQTSGQHGDYAAAALNPGTYTVVATAPGFSTFTTTGIVVQSQQTVRTDVPLKIGSVGTQVVVTGGAPVIEAEMPSISTTVTSEELTQTSSNLLGTKDSTGDSGLEEYIALLPTGHQGSGSQWSMAGSTAGEAYYNVDGISSNSTLYGNADGPAFPSYDIVQEVKYDAVNNKAEMGQLLNITVITKSGTNRLHGSIFEHFGNQNLQAQSYFSSTNPAYTDNDFGGGIGGPIRRDRIFFSGAYEGLRNNQPLAINPNLPTLAFRTGDFSSLLNQATPVVIKNPYTGLAFPGNVVFPSLLQTPQSQAAQKWQSMFYPSPNYGAVNQFIGNYRETVPQSIYSNRFDLRFDANLAPANSAFVRFTYNRASPEILDSGLPPSETGYRVQVRKTFSGVVSDTWIITPNLINVAKVGAEWTNNNFHPVLQGQAILTNLGIQGFPLAPDDATGFPALSISSTTSPGQVGPANGTEQNNQVIDQMTWQYRSQTIKGGFEYRPQYGTQPYFPSFGAFTFNGSESGNAYADFLLGLPRATTYTYNRPTEYARQYFLSGFIQDDWRARRDLMISIGLRYDFDSAPVDKYDTISSFDPTTGSIVVPSLSNVQKYLTPGFPAQIPIVSAQSAGFPARSLRNPFRLGFFPRFGFAYNLNEKTVIRGGYGMYNDDLTIDLFNDLYQAPYGGTISYTNSITAGTPAITFTNPTNTSAGKIGAIAITGIDKNSRNPYVEQWNLTVERDIGFNTGLRLSYIGSETNYLLYGRNLNQVPASATTHFSQASTLYPLFKTVKQESNGGTQSYNALTAEVNHHMKRGLLFEAAVTWAKNLTDDPSTSDAENGVVAEDTYNFARQRGNEQYTPRFQFVSNLVYSLPIGRGQSLLNSDNIWTRILGGWQLSAAYLGNTGNFLTPMFSGVDPTNINAFGGSVSTGNVSPAAVGKQTVNNWFNPKGYAIPQPGQFGNAGFGILKGPDSQVLNSALFKSFPIVHESSLEISASFSNVLNHPNFANPDVTITDGGAGKITGVQGYMFGPRSGLVSVRYTF
ncbi:MAG: carboxypeptidase-like regulatory domain-containing protein [Acidobacteriota bacterium]|nr:carboxypeptidase-like regulatory domain-containing protein [Acidobacteriota bacterium]